MDPCFCDHHKTGVSELTLVVHTVLLVLQLVGVRSK